MFKYAVFNCLFVQLNTAYLNMKRSTRQNIACENARKYLDSKNEEAPCQDIVADDIVVDNISQPGPSQGLNEFDGYTMKFEREEMQGILKQFKKDEAAEKKGIKATGGGIFKPALTNIGAQMLAIMGDQIKPLTNNCDSAARYFSNDAVVVPTENVLYTPIQKPVQKTPVHLKKRNKNVNIDFFKKKYYKTKAECAILEKKTKLIEYRMALKKKEISDLELLIKKKEYQNMP